MSLGFTRGSASPVLFYHPVKDLWGVVRGDDFVFNGLDRDLDFVRDELMKKYEIKDRGRLGFGQADVREIDILGRVLKLHWWGISWEADNRHRNKILEYFGMEPGSKPLSKTGYKEDQ